METKHKALILGISILAIVSINVMMCNIEINDPYGYNNGGIGNTEENLIEYDVRASETDYYFTEWISNGDFSLGSTDWYNEISGDTLDFNLGVSAGTATYEVVGDERIFSLNENPIVGSNWLAVQNPDIPYLPDSVYSDSEGLKVSHTFTDNGDANQIPSAHWDNNFTMPVDMSDYVITSASIQTAVNATVSRDVDVSVDSYATDGGAALNQRQSYDFVRFYVLLSDLSKDKVFELGYYQPQDLGAGDPYPTPGIDTLSDTYLITVSEEVLIFYLTSVLSSDNFNFTLTLGIRIYAADSSTTYDTDTFTELLIKTINLQFTYEKKINQLNSASWRQDAGIIPSHYIIENATLNFQYKIDKDWTINTGSINSEFRIIINTNQLGQTVKLATATSTYQDFKVGGLDISGFLTPNEDVNISIQVYIGDEITLNSSITISIDNVSLIINYGIFTPPINTDVQLFLNDQNKTIEKSTEITYGKILNITAKFTNNTGVFIQDALVQISGSGITQVNLSENITFEHYNISIDTTELGIGTSYLFLTASKRYYESQLITIRIDVINRETEIHLFLEGNNETIDKSIDLAWDESLNITVKYFDIEEGTLLFLSGATVELTGLGVPQNLTENLSLEQYYIIINTKDLGVGSTFLTVYAQKQNYSSTSIRFRIQVLNRDTFIDNIRLNGASQTTIEIPWNENLDISVSFNDTTTNAFIGGATIQITGTGFSASLPETGSETYENTINTAALGVGIKFLTITASQQNYTLASYLITVTVTERNTLQDIFLDGSAITSIEFPHAETLNITSVYLDSVLTSFISSASVELREGENVIASLTQHGTYDQYELLIDTRLLNIGVNVLGVYAKQDNHSASLVSITVTVTERTTTQQIYLNNSLTTSIEYPYLETLNITSMYFDSVLSSFISGAMVELRDGEIVIATFSPHGSYAQYELLLDTSVLNIGVNVLGVHAKQDNYSASLVSITITVTERYTSMDVYLNESSLTSIEYPYAEILNITVSYRDTLLDAFINGANVELREGSTTLSTFSQHGVYDQYYLDFDTANFNVGVHTFNIYAKQDNYSISLESIVITIAERDTHLEILINGQNSIFFSYYNSSIGELLNITSIYRDHTGYFLDNSVVELTGEGISEILIKDLVYDQYSTSLMASNLGVGVHFLTITAKKDNYSISIQNIKINVKERQTNMQLYLDEVNATDTRYISVEIGDVINITVYLTDFLNGSDVTGATINLIGPVNGILTFNPSYNHYNITINADDLGQGINFLTVFAQKQDYESQSILFTIEVTELLTNLHLFLNEINKTLDKSIQVTVGDIVNISLIYEDYTGAFIDGALVQLVGEGLSHNLTEHLIYDLYNFSLDSRDLNFGVNFLTLYAQKYNYQPQTIIIKIEIIDKETDLNLYLNNLNKTLDPTFELPIDATLNITVRYFDFETGDHISGALIQLIGEGLTENMTEFLVYEQYSILINTNQIDIGVRFLSILAQKSNYQSFTMQLRVQVNRIQTNINTTSGEDVIYTRPGEPYTLSIRLFDMDFGQPITNANVTFTGFGAGGTLEHIGDGVYEQVLNNLPEGETRITITAYAGDDYDFERFVISIYVVRAPEETWLFIVLTIVGIAAAACLGAYLLAYQKVLKYPKQVRKIHKYKKSLDKKNAPKVDIQTPDDSVSEVYSEELEPISKGIKGKLKGHETKVKNGSETGITEKFDSEDPDVSTEIK